TPRLSSPPNGAEPLRRALQARGDDVPHGSRGGRPGPRAQGRGRVEPEPRRREGLRHVRGTRPGAHEHPRRSRHRARGAAPRERSRRCRGDDFREEGLMDEVRLGHASVTLLSVVRGLPSEEAIDMDEVTYTENYVDCVSTL